MTSGVPPLAFEFPGRPANFTGFLVHPGLEARCLGGKLEPFRLMRAVLWLGGQTGAPPEALDFFVTWLGGAVQQVAGFTCFPRVEACSLGKICSR